MEQNEYLLEMLDVYKRQLLYEIVKKFSTIKADHSLNISYITSYTDNTYTDYSDTDLILVLSSSSF